MVDRLFQIEEAVKKISDRSPETPHNNDVHFPRKDVNTLIKRMREPTTIVQVVEQDQDTVSGYTKRKLPTQMRQASQDHAPQTGRGSYKSFFHHVDIVPNF